MSTYDVENPNRIEKSRNILLACMPWTVSGKKKGYRKRTRGTYNLLYIDQLILSGVKARRKNVAMPWIVYKMAYDMLPQIWIIECQKVYKISDSIINLITKAIENCRIQLTTGRQTLAEVKIRRGIFQGDYLSPLSYILRRIYGSLQIYKITGNDQPPYIYKYIYIYR